MTTNRPVDFDEAFFSRIHLTLHFPKLDIESRKAIWSNFLKPAGASLNDNELRDLAEAEMNGRQIKNVVKMARLLAANEKEAVRLEHVKDVLDVMQADAQLIQSSVSRPRAIHDWTDSD